MVFVVLGTQEKSFSRLVAEVERLADSNIINDEIIVQAGNTHYKAKNPRMNILSLIPMDEFSAYIEKASLVICHAGYGIISNAVSAGKKVIAVPRLSKYNEHYNDHQKQILREFSNAGYIIGANEVEQLKSAVIRSRNFVPVPYSVNFEKLQKMVADFIDRS